MSVWFTSDLHFCHDREFLYGPRGFDNVEQMNRAIIENWNSVVGNYDVVYVLGDLMLNDNERAIHYINQLKGYIYIICGNHDTNTRRAMYESLYNVVEVSDAKVVKVDGYNFFLCHYPVLCANYDDDEKPLSRQLISLCGHTHTKDKFADWDKGWIYHVELDAHNCFPVSSTQIFSDIKQKIGVSR